MYTYMTLINRVLKVDASSSTYTLNSKGDNTPPCFIL